MEVSLEQASQHNPSMLVSSKSKEGREKVLSLIQSGRIDECRNLFVVREASIFVRMKNKIRNFIKK